MGTYHVLVSCMLLYVSLTCNLMQNYYTKKSLLHSVWTTKSFGNTNTDSAQYKENTRELATVLGHSVLGWFNTDFFLVRVIQHSGLYWLVKVLLAPNEFPSITHKLNLWQAFSPSFSLSSGAFFVFSKLKQKGRLRDRTSLRSSAQVVLNCVPQRQQKNAKSGWKAWLTWCRASQSQVLSVRKLHEATYIASILHGACSQCLVCMYDEISLPHMRSG